MFIYPWGDFHSLNLGWFLQQFKEWTAKIQEYLDNGGGTSENLANVIAPVFNAENSYLTGDYVLYNDELYKALEPVPSGTWNPDAWERCIVTEEMGSSASGIDNVVRLMIAGQYSNTYNYQKYAICRYNDKLWMCNTNLPAGGEEWVPSHWDEITVGAGLTGLRRSADTLSQAINAANEAISQETEARQEADSVLQESINTLQYSVSDLADDLGTEATTRGNADNAIESAIAIVANNNTHAAIASGQYVYIKNHGTLADGLYIAITAIPLNDPISSANVNAVANGGLNDLKQTITPIELTIINPHENLTGTKLTLINGILYLSFHLTNTELTGGSNRMFDFSNEVPFLNGALARATAISNGETGIFNGIVELYNHSCRINCVTPGTYDLTVNASFVVNNIKS